MNKKGNLTCNWFFELLIRQPFVVIVYVISEEMSNGERQREKRRVREMSTSKEILPFKKLKASPLEHNICIFFKERLNLSTSADVKKNYT